MISIIIPTYNRAYTLKRSIDSVLNQTFQDFELIIIDDCSIDNTEEIVSEYRDNRIRYIKLRKNVGSNQARNLGVKYSQYDYIAFQDSDDEWLPTKLEKQYNQLKARNLDVIFCKINRFDNEKKTVIPNFDIDEKLIPTILLRENFISTQTVLGKKECFITESFDEELPRLQDWDLMIRISQKYKIGIILEPLVNVYVQNDSITRNVKLIDALDIMEKKYYHLISKDKKAILNWNRIRMVTIDSIYLQLKLLLDCIVINPFYVKVWGTFFKIIINRLRRKK